MKRLDKPLRQDGTYDCYTCREAHYTRQRVSRVVLSGSTIHGIGSRLSVGEGLKCHIDFITIPDGDTEDLHHACSAEYKLNPVEIEVLVIAPGLRDFVNGKSLDYIKEKLSNMKDDMMSWNPKNTVAFTTTLLPPKLANFIEQHFRCYRDATEELMDLNFWIQNKNTEINPAGKSTHMALRLHCWGLYFEEDLEKDIRDNEGNFLQYKEVLIDDSEPPIMRAALGHRPSCWSTKSGALPDALDLNTHMSTKIVSKCSDYFLAHEGKISPTREPRHPADDIDELRDITKRENLCPV